MRILSKITLLTLLGTCIFSISKAQKIITEGTLTYDIVYDLTDDQKKTIDAENLPSISKVKFNGNLSKIEIDMGVAVLKMIVDGPGRAAILLVDVPIFQKQYATKLSKEDLDKQGGNLTFSDFKASGEKSEIAGYAAEKYTYTDNNKQAYEVWLAPDLKLAPGAILPEFAGLNGSPVKYISLQYGIKTVLTLKSVKEEKTGPFTLTIPSGYEVKSSGEMDEMFKMLRGEN